MTVEHRTERICKECGLQTQLGWTFCAWCGFELDAPEILPSCTKGAFCGQRDGHQGECDDVPY